jgi:type II secretory pathway pseudopilin PulG
MMIAVSILMLLTLLAVPKFKVIKDRSNVNGARARVEGAVATARASAIHRGRLSLFMASGQWISVWTQNPTTSFWEQQVPWHQIDDVYPGVRLEVGGPGMWYVYYEPRGITWSSAKPPSTLVFRVVGSTTSDSVCVSRQGFILPRGCTL